MTYPIRAAAVLLLLGLACCGGGAKSRKAAQDGLSVAMSATNAARDTFIVWSADRQMTIAKTATSEADGQAKLADFRARREKVVLVFAAAYSSIAVAASALALAEEDTGKLTAAITLVGDALRAVLAVRQAIAAFQGAAP